MSLSQRYDEQMQSSPINPNDLIKLAKLSLLLGRTQRITFHEDGVTPESDTDHTVMLGLMACAIAEHYYPELDKGKVAQFALVHDLVEAYAGDTPTLRIDPAGQMDKEARERAALARIKREFGSILPWVPNTITVYEHRDEPEARFVKAVDKIVPKLTHILNDGASLRDQNIALAEAMAMYDHQREQIKEYAHDFPELLELREVLVRQMKSKLT
jgi:putative hydrolase of HD superfamily